MSQPGKCIQGSNMLEDRHDPFDYSLPGRYRKTIHYLS